SKGRAENDEDDDPNHVRRALGHDDRGCLRHRHAVRLGQDEGLENLADLARRYGEDEAREEREEAIELRHATDIEPRQVELPLEIAQEVVPEGEPAGDRERGSLKVRERLPDLSKSSVDGDRAVHADESEHDDQDAAEVNLHGRWIFEEGGGVSPRDPSVP